jgi:hypothetical protein
LQNSNTANIGNSTNNRGNNKPATINIEAPKEEEEAISPVQKE